MEDRQSLDEQVAALRLTLAEAGIILEALRLAIVDELAPSVMEEIRKSSDAIRVILDRTRQS